MGRANASNIVGRVSRCVWCLVRILDLFILLPDAKGCGALLLGSLLGSVNGLHSLQLGLLPGPIPASCIRVRPQHFPDAKGNNVLAFLPINFVKLDLGSTCLNLVNRDEAGPGQQTAGSCTTQGTEQNGRPASRCAWHAVLVCRQVKIGVLPATRKMEVVSRITRAKTAAIMKYPADHKCKVLHTCQCMLLVQPLRPYFS